MKPYLDKIRFLPLNDPAVWNSAVMGGIVGRIGHVEISQTGCPTWRSGNTDIQEETEELK